MAKNFISSILGLPDKWDIVELDPADIVPNPHQPRETFNDASLHNLAQSIRDLGLIHPVIVRRLPGKRYELVAGERRLRAAKLAGLKKIPALAKDISTDDSIRHALVENLQREDLSLLEEARAYSFLHGEMKMTQKDIARFVGKSQPLVSNLLRALELPGSVRRLIADGRINRVQARDLVRLKTSEEQVAAARRFVGETPPEDPPPPSPANKKQGIRRELKTVRASMDELRRQGASVIVAEESGDSGRTIHFKVHIPNNRQP